MPDHDPMDIGGRKQLFLDSSLLATHKGVRTTMHSPRRTGELLLAPEAPWEKDLYIGYYGSVLQDAGKIRIWYFLTSDRVRCVCYAESHDGIHFEKPILDRHELNGSRRNNVVMPGPDGGCCVWMDPDAPTDQRYRSQAKSYPGWPDDNTQKTEFQLYASPDGLDWRRMPIQMPGDCDTQSIIFPDARTGRYFIYTREWVRFKDPAKSYRVVRRLESDDLACWDNQKIVMEADETDLKGRETPTGQPPVDYYGADVFNYPDRNGPYIMLAQPFWHWQSLPPEQKLGLSGDPRRATIERLGPGTIDVRLCWSADGLNFQHAGDRRPFMALGPAGSFDSRRIWVLPDPIVMKDELWIYYAGGNMDHHHFVDSTATAHQTGISRAVLRLDGFVSLDAGPSAGELITKPLVFNGSRLEFNVVTQQDGCLRVELQDEQGKSIPGYSIEESIPFTGNSVRATARWKNGKNISSLAGRPVRLHLSLQSGELYAFQFV